jgi:hypothetical protein
MGAHRIHGDDVVWRGAAERAWLANAFVAKAVLGLTTTVGLIERLTVDRALRRICGFPLCRLPSGAASAWADEALIKEHLGDELIGHLSRDATAIEARERPARSGRAAATPAPAAQSSLVELTPGGGEKRNAKADCAKRRGQPAGGGGAASAWADGRGKAREGTGGGGPLE